MLDHGHESRSSLRREHSIRYRSFGCIGRRAAPLKTRRACWRDAKKARQYIAGGHPVGASCLVARG
ncbi:hypothetical protein BN844_2857 [Pseudomonas sp. SHC52]|nr:hypothetical protein BN844_2857 [Pseudomonas sp. SHC52]